MCMDKWSESRPIRLTEDLAIWKVFEEVYNAYPVPFWLEGIPEWYLPGDVSIHQKWIVPTRMEIHSHSPKSFRCRHGFMAFRTFNEAAQYAIELSSRNPDDTFKVRKCIAPRGARLISGKIKIGYVGAEKPCIRVESYIKGA